MSDDVLLFPFNGNAREALCCLLGSGAVARPAGFVDDAPETHDMQSCGVPVLGGREWLGKMPYVKVLAVPGSASTYQEREAVIASLGLAAGRFATLVHGRAIVAADAAVGINSLVMPGAFIGPGARIGNHCIVMAGAVVSHDTEIGDFSIIAAGAVLAGYVRLGRGCYVGAGSRIRERTEMGDGALLGMGAVAVKDIPAGEKHAGVPARRMEG